MNRFYNIIRPLKWLPGLLMVALVAGCGGGGGGGGGAPILGGGGVAGVVPPIVVVAPPVIPVAPTVTYVAPLPKATGVPINTKIITATFTKAMDVATLIPANFSLACPVGTPVTGATSYLATANTAELLLPLATNLPANTLCTGTITTAVKDTTGIALASNFVWTFTTAALVDTIAPTVTGTTHANGANNVPINAKAGVTFSEAMDPSTVNAVTFTFKQGLTPVAGTVSYIGVSAVFTPSIPLASNTLYTGTITTGAKDLAGNPLAGNYVWSWTTAVAADTTAPTVLSTINANGAVNVPINTQVGATFSEALNALTVTNANFILKQGATVVPGVISYSGVNASFIPTNPLTINTLYAVTIKGGVGGVADLAGNAMASDYVWSWTTAPAAAVIIPPTVLSTNPLDVAIGVCINKTINATFSAAMDPLSLTNINITLAPTATPLATVAGLVTYDAVTHIASFNPTANLLATTGYTATIKGGVTGVKDIAGNALVVDKVTSFTTGTATSCTPPVALGAASLFGGMGGNAGITNQGIFTVVNGDIGTTAASTLITGFHDTGGNLYTQTPLNIGTVNGTIYTATAPPGSVPGVIAAAGLLAANTAYINMSPAALPGGIDVSTLGGGAGELGGRTLAAGVYKSAPGTYAISLGDLTLDAGGDPNAVWVFQMASSLTVGIAGPTGARSVILINGAQAKNVFWQVGSAATINAAGGGTMVGTIIASAGVTFSTAGNVVLTTLNGRALGLNASVTLVNTIINVPAP